MRTSLTQKLSTALRFDLKRDTDIGHFVLKHPGDSYSLLPPHNPPLSMSPYTVPLWHELGKPATRSEGRSRGFVNGWRRKAFRYEPWVKFVEELENIAEHKVVENWRCDIRSVAGLFQLSNNHYPSLIEFVQAEAPELIQDVSEQGLKINMIKGEVPTQSYPSARDRFEWYTHDRRIFFCNSDATSGAHFAAAQYIATKLGMPVILTGTLHAHAVSMMDLSNLRIQYDVFVTRADEDFTDALHRSLRYHRADYLALPLPEPLTSYQAVLLPKNNTGSREVAIALQHAGYTDLCALIRSIPTEGPPPSGLA